MNNIMNFINNIEEDNLITLESLFSMSSNSKKDILNSWYNKIFSGHSFMGDIFSIFNKIDTDENYIYIKGVDYKKLLNRIKKIYGEKNIEKIFIKTYNERDMQKFNRKVISRQRMRIENIKTPNFFSLELAIIFNDLYERYRESVYGRIAKQIYAKSWISTADKKDISKIPLDNLSRISLTLNDYQKEFIENYNILKGHLNLDGFILTFEQGMGKTLTSISLAECLNTDNVYIICPNTVQENWMLEIRKYYHKYQNNPELWKKEVVKCADNTATKNARFFIINNESISKMLPYVKSGNNMLIIDESQNFRNNSGKRVSELLELKDKLKPKNILAMSGTPIKASPNELVPIMRLIDPLFTEEASDIYDKCFKLDTALAMNIVNDRFGKIIYRKTKELLDLPEKKIDNLSYTISDSNKFLLSNVKLEISNRFNEIYSERLKDNDSLRKEFIELISKYSNSSNEDKNRYIKWVVTINTGKDVSLHELDAEFMNTYIEKYIHTNNIDPNIYGRINWLNTNFIKMKQSSMGKAIGEILPKRRRDMFNSIYDENKENIIKRILDNNEKTIIFSQLKGTIDYICDSLNKDGIKTVKITGDIKERLPVLMQFKEDDETLVLCATSQSLGTGVTLIEASQMFFFGAPWRSADFDQCTDRIHRIGQKAEVHIYNVLLNTSTKNLSSRMNDILNWSSEMFDSAIKQLEDNNPIMDIYANESYNYKEDKKSMLSYLKDFIACESTKSNSKTIPELEEVFKDDPIRKKISIMIATSHEYKDKPNIEAGIKFAKNYDWSEKDIALDKLQGINKPVIKEKVFEIAKAMDGKDNKWPVIAVDKIHGIYPQSKGKAILFDGHHRLEAMLFVGMKDTPCYYGKYNGDSEKSLDELKESNESYNYKEGNNMSNSLDEFIITCESNLIVDEAVSEGFFGKVKNKNESNIVTREEYKSLHLPKLKKIYDDSKSEVLKIMNKAEHKLASKGFKLISDTKEIIPKDQPFNVNIYDWALYRIYGDGEEVTMRLEDDDTDEFDSLCKEILDCVKRHAGSQFSNAEVSRGKNPKYGVICVKIPGMKISDNASEGFLDKFKKKEKIEESKSTDNGTGYRYLFKNVLDFGYFERDNHREINNSDIIKVAKLNNDTKAIHEFVKNEYGDSKELKDFIDKYNLVPVINMNTGEHIWYSLKNKKLYDEMHGTEDTFSENRSYTNIGDLYKALESNYQFTEEDEAVLESYLSKALESKMTSAERTALPDSSFGLISDGKRKYPLFLKDPEESKKHIRQAIKFFHFCPEKDRRELGKNIMKAAKKYGIEIDEKSMIRKYL